MLGSFPFRQLPEAAKVLRAERRFQKRATRASTLIRFGFRPAPVTAEDLEAARLAWRRLGEGRHPAALNFGISLACAFALETAEPLLYKGSDLPTPTFWQRYHPHLGMLALRADEVRRLSQVT